VILELYKLRLTYFGLKSRTKALRSAKLTVKPAEAEGFELQSTGQQVSEKVQDDSSPAALQQKGLALRKDWDDWKSALISNALV
jgi:hypothetical protein